MQTFRAPSDDGTNSNPKKDDYKPFLPEDAVIDTTQNNQPALAQTPAVPTPESVTPQVPAMQAPPNPIEQPIAQPMPQSAAAPQQPVYAQPPAQQFSGNDGKQEIFYYQPEHVYYPPTQQQFQATHAGMDRRKFRSLIIGFLLLALAGFLAIIILFGLRGSRDFYKQGQQIADITIFTPQFEATIAPPFQVVGEAREYWFDDNDSFPVTVYDNKDLPVMYGSAIAQGESDDDFIPFQAILERYDAIPIKKRGYIALTGPGYVGEAQVYTIPIEFKKRGRNFVVGPPLSTAITGNNTNSNDNSSSSSSNSSSSSGSSSSGSNSNSGSGSSSSGSGGSSGGSSSGGNGNTGGTTNTVNTCANGVDDDNDGLFDINDPECHSDFNALNFSSYVTGNQELDSTNTTPNNSGSNGGGTNGGGSGASGFTGTHPGTVVLHFPNINDNPFNPSCNKLFPRNRSLGAGDSADVARETLEALIAGPTPTEISQGNVSGVKKGLDVNSFNLSSSGTLTIDFAQSNIIADTDLCSRAEVERQIEKTMLQFPDVNAVNVI